MVTEFEAKLFPRLARKSRNSNSRAQLRPLIFGTMGSDNNHCSFVLLAEFHIYEGAQLKYQFPQPLGIDEGFAVISCAFPLKDLL
jgi:hypothetical protein